MAVTLPYVLFGDDEKADLLAPGNTIDTIDLSSTPSPPPEEDTLSEASEASEPCTVNRTRRSVCLHHFCHHPHLPSATHPSH